MLARILVAASVLCTSITASSAAATTGNELLKWCTDEKDFSAQAECGLHQSRARTINGDQSVLSGRRRHDRADGGHGC